MNKKEARKRAKEFRSSLSSDEVQIRSEKATKKLIELVDSMKPQRVHIYSSIKKTNEIITSDAIRFFLDSKTMAHSFIKQNGGWVNIDLLSGEEYKTEKYDMIIIPMLAGDESGNRVGHGIGFYDKFLSDQKQALKVGLCYKEAVVNSLESETHDIKLHIIIRA